MRLLEAFLEKILEILGQCKSEITVILANEKLYQPNLTFRMSQHPPAAQLPNLAASRIVYDSVHNQSEDIHLRWRLANIPE